MKNKKEVRKQINNNMRQKICLLIALVSIVQISNAQDNPYEVFGHKSKVEYKTQLYEYLVVKNSDTTAIIRSIAFNLESGAVLMLNEKDSILSINKLEPNNILRFIGVDPMAHKRSWVNPYNFVQNNPLNRVDPTGALDAPIYGTDGSFLGTDDQGLQGKAIVMNASDFKQGMSHQNALSKSLGVQGLSSSNAQSKLLNHYNGLKSRPDYDGKLTFAEAIKWYNKGTGEALYVDAAKINLSSINTTIFEGKSNSLSIEFFPTADEGEQNHYPHPSTGPIYGHMQVTLFNANSGQVRLGPDAATLQQMGLPPMTLDVFDFGKGSTAGKVADYLYPGTPKDFNIIMYNNITKIKTAQDIQNIRDNINKVMMERPKF